MYTLKKAAIKSMYLRTNRLARATVHHSANCTRDGNQSAHGLWLALESCIVLAVT